jgi:hypothetical protein
MKGKEDGLLGAKPDETRHLRRWQRSKGGQEKPSRSGRQQLAAKVMMNGVEARTCLLRATKCRNGRLDRREAPDTKVNLNEEMGSYTSCGWCIAAGDVLKFGRGVERLGRGGRDGD